jgi:hypothetical protein
MSVPKVPMSNHLLLLLSPPLPRCVHIFSLSLSLSPLTCLLSVCLCLSVCLSVCLLLVHSLISTLPLFLKSYSTPSRLVESNIMPLCYYYNNCPNTSPIFYYPPADRLPTNQPTTSFHCFSFEVHCPLALDLARSFMFTNGIGVGRVQVMIDCTSILFYTLPHTLCLFFCRLFNK